MVRTFVMHCVPYKLTCRAFDVELLYITEQLKIPIKEVAITWHEVDGTLELVHTVYFTNQCTIEQVRRSFRSSVGSKWAVIFCLSD